MPPAPLEYESTAARPRRGHRRLFLLLGVFLIAVSVISIYAASKYFLVMSDFAQPPLVSKVLVYPVVCLFGVAGMVLVIAAVVPRRRTGAA